MRILVAEYDAALASFVKKDLESPVQWQSSACEPIGGTWKTRTVQVGM